MFSRESQPLSWCPCILVSLDPDRVGTRFPSQPPLCSPGRVSLYPGVHVFWCPWTLIGWEVDSPPSHLYVLQGESAFILVSMYSGDHVLSMYSGIHVLSWYPCHPYVILVSSHVYVFFQGESAFTRLRFNCIKNVVYQPYSDSVMISLWRLRDGRRGMCCVEVGRGGGGVLLQLHVLEIFKLFYSYILSRWSHRIGMNKKVFYNCLSVLFIQSVNYALRSCWMLMFIIAECLVKYYYISLQTSICNTKDSGESWTDYGRHWCLWVSWGFRCKNLFFFVGVFFFFKGWIGVDGWGQVDEPILDPKEQWK